MTSVAGHARPSLSKPADQITLLDIYKAVEGEKPLLHLDTHTNPDCGIGINIQLSLQGFYDESLAAYSLMLCTWRPEILFFLVH